MTKPVDFAYALKSFMGYLEGTQKAAHTIKNYRFDILAFERFLKSERGDKPVRLDEVTQDTMERFHQQLKREGLKANTRRRKLITVRRFLAYLAQRNKVPEELAHRQPTPNKVERVPFTVPYEVLSEAIRSLPVDSELENRNRVLLWVLAETGCLVSEAARLRFDQFVRGSSGPVLRWEGKAARNIAVSEALQEAVEALRERAEAKTSGSRKRALAMFEGYNRFGSMGKPMTPRGVELLVRYFATRQNLGEGFTPRTFRHSAAIRWFKEGITREEIQRRLGLRTRYAFRSYEPLLKESRPESVPSGL